MPGSDGKAFKKHWGAEMTKTITEWAIQDGIKPDTAQKMRKRRGGGAWLGRTWQMTLSEWEELKSHLQEGPGRVKVKGEN